MATTSTQRKEQLNGPWIAKTARLTIRQLNEADLPALIPLFGSLEVMRYSVTGPLTPPQVTLVLDKILNSYHNAPLALWGVFDTRQQFLIGLCGFLRRDIPGTTEWELAYRYFPQFWGQGMATEAAIACRDVALRQPDVECIVALIEPGNHKSIRVAEKTGLEFDRATHLDGLPILRFSLRR